MSGTRRYVRRSTLTEAEAQQVADVFSEHRRFIENVARQHAHSVDVVADIVQTVGVRVCQGLAGFRGDSELRTWLYRVTVNTARETYQGERRHQRAVAAALDQVTVIEHVVDPDAQAVSSERLDALRQAVGRLRPQHRAAIHGTLRNEIPTATIQINQKQTEPAPATVRTQRFRARRALKELLNDDPRLES